MNLNFDEVNPYKEKERQVSYWSDIPVLADYIISTSLASDGTTYIKFKMPFEEFGKLLDYDMDDSDIYIVKRVIHNYSEVLTPMSAWFAIKIAGGCYYDTKTKHLDLSTTYFNISMKAKEPIYAEVITNYLNLAHKVNQGYPEFTGNFYINPDL